jgi:uncharacterized protein YkwD
MGFRCDHVCHRILSLRIARTVLLAVAGLCLASLAANARPPQTASAERLLFEAANRERIAQGLLPLRWDAALAAAARQHAEHMAMQNTLSHQLPGELSLEERARQAGARYSVIAENIAEGPSAEEIHASWMRSPPHRANLLDRDLTAVGIAVVSLADRPIGGTMLFAVQDFSQSVANLSLEQQERQVSAQLAARGLRVSNAVGASDDARKTCQMDRGWAGNRPGLVVRYETSDPSRLPDDLEQNIQSGRYRAASVGACSAGVGRGFSHSRVAVLLF